ncbi:MAG TPA: hypothetical protein VFH88_15605 [Candidatus Krumholzibacteria bacterium]|nr:hypothetical protein [Candidatus Krumholzibacteria bacterium]
MTRTMLFPLLLVVLWFAPAAHAQEIDAPVAEAQDSVTSVTTVPQRDLMDVLARLLHKRVEPEVGGTLPVGLEWALLPTFSYNPVYGAAFGALISGAGQRSSTVARYSQLGISANYSTKGQLQAQVRGELFSTSGNTLTRIDLRYLDTDRSTWGLGDITSDQQEYPMSFKLARVYGTVYRRASGPVFVGVGYHYDEFREIVDDRAQNGETTPFVEYSGAGVTRTVASGISLNVLGDTRDNIVNATSGYYLSASVRDYAKTLGSDSNWQELWVEMRVYPDLPARSRNVLGFWIYSWLTFGKAPYLNLPANGWDTYGRSARGYLQGRIRGANVMYFESEYRHTLTQNGLLGMVVFLNGTATTNPETNTFTHISPAAGTGLRFKLNKHTNTNISLDYGWGRDDQKGLFLGMTEVF